MVMETPSAQCVGREFVRQYYTLLNEAPKFLHRFYSNNSSFIHGGVEKAGEEQQPVMGQMEIHKKITSLNFNDCHAKIRQVDSQATVGTAVVVQVTGELSNNGEPMRRFMQTFVLAPQTPKKYYVHNDIFRYQDEVFQDTDESEEDDTDQQQQQRIETSPERVPPSQLIENAQAEMKLYNQTPQFSQSSSPTMKPDSPQPTPVPDQETAQTTQINGMHEPQIIQTPSPTEPVTQRPETPEETEPEPTAEPEQSPSTPEPVPTEQEVPVESKPLSWASLISKSGSGAPVPSAVQAPVATVPTSQTAPPKPSSDPTPAQASSGPTQQTPIEDFVPQNSQRGARQNRDNRDNVTSRENRPQRTGFGTGMSGDDADDRQQQRYPDNMQVFVGNLPHDIAEAELKEFFSKYGTVIGVRINRNQSQKVPFGFVVFEDANVVKTVLDEKRVEYNGQRLNVEVKKARGDGRPNSNSRLGGRGPRDGMRQQQQQHRGGSRGPMGQREGSGNRADGRSSNMNRTGASGPPRR